MDNHVQRPLFDSPSLLAGIALILVGGFLLFLQLVSTLFGFPLGHFLWPFYIIVPGAMLFLFGLFSQTHIGEPLTMVGAMVTATGLLLFFQNLTGMWASWAYAWALIAPTSIGVGQMFYGIAKGRQDLVRSGARLAKVGLAIFLGAGVFFELMIGVSGFGLGRWAWSLLLIALGAVLMLRAFLPSLHNRE
jgi:hypothetical protein